MAEDKKQAEIVGGHIFMCELNKKLVIYDSKQLQV